MKTKPILLLLFFTIFTLSASSQTTYGLRAGINLANATISLDGWKLSPSGRAGINVGGFVNFSLKDKMSIQPELNFSQMGWKIEGVKERYNYLSMPVLIKYNIENLDVFAGPQLSFHTSTKRIEKDEYSLGDSTSVDEPEIKPDVKSTELAAIVGIDYTLMDKFIVGARYQAGLTNAIQMEDKEAIIWGNQRLKNNALTLSIGFRF